MNKFRYLASFVAIIPVFVCGEHANAAEASLNAEVPPRESKTIRLKYIPRGATIKVNLNTNGAITVLLMGSKSFAKLPRVVRPLFQGTAEKKLSFSVKIEKTDHYYLVLDNKANHSPREVELVVNAHSGTTKPSARQTLAKFEAILHSYLTFKPFPAEVKPCEQDPPENPNRLLTLCTEYIQQLNKMLEEKADVGAMIMFSLFHSAGHVILSQWNNPAHGDEAKADEFAAALLAMLGQKQETESAMRSFLSRTSIIKKNNYGYNNGHVLTVKRGKKIIHMLEDVEFLRKQHVDLVPHIRTRQLKRLLQNPQPWTDIESIKKELSRRGSGGSKRPKKNGNAPLSI